MGNHEFSRRSRAADLAAAAGSSEPVDVLVVGLGVTGAGVALDAASRGLSVLAVDRGDLASGTSSKSSKLVHGGLRYLENYEFGLVREGVTERQLLLRLAPHLVRPMDFLYPVWPDTARRRLLGLGLTTYDVFAAAALAGRASARHRHTRLDPAAAVELAPALADSELAYAYRYVDCGTDDARLVLAVTQEARRFGARTATYAEVVSLVHDAAGQVAGAVLRDQLEGTELTVRARQVVNATGVWVDRLQGLDQPGREALVQPSKGVHLVVPHHRLPLERASVLLPSRQGDGRSMFAIPWGPQTIVGTTDTRYDGSLDELSLTGPDLEYVLRSANAVFRRGLTPDDVLGAWAGVRPLLGTPGSTATSDLSRRHTLVESDSGLLTITGGKLTTYRRMARDVVDRVVARAGRKAPCRTARIPLLGQRPDEEVVAETEQAAQGLGLPPGTGQALVRQAGERASEILSLVAQVPELGRPLAPGLPHLAAEVVHAARHEGAVTLDDIFSRRLRLSLRCQDAALPQAGWAAQLLAAETGQDPSWAADQVTAYARAVAAERGVLGLAAAGELPAAG